MRFFVYRNVPKFLFIVLVMQLPLGNSQPWISKLNEDNYWKLNGGREIEALTDYFSFMIGPRNTYSMQRLAKYTINLSVLKTINFETFCEEESDYSLL